MMDVATEIATAIASGAGGSLGGKGVDAVGRLLSALRTKFHSDPVARRRLAVAAEASATPAAAERLASLLRERAAGDNEFAAWLSSLWGEVRLDMQTDESRTVNVVSGTTHGPVIQAGKIIGDINL